mmetsp:Transcript_3665/g.4077  ORF Transcript_3665/g.4077 Transcript_3665/m.4077 type:complete len:191 (+) Transcript_3665:87-659(+)
MTYQTDETISLTNEADSNLPKEELSSHHKWLGAVAAALLLGGGGAVVVASSLSSSLSSSSSSLSNTNLIGRTVSPGSLGVWCDDPDLKKHAEGGGMSLRHYDPVYVIYDSHEGASWNYGCKGWAWYANNSDIDVCGSRGFGSGPCRPSKGDVCCDLSKVGTNCAKIDYGTKDEYRDYNKPTKHWYCSEYN